MYLRHCKYLRCCKYLRRYRYLRRHKYLWRCSIYLGSVHLIKYIFVLDICCQQFEGYIFWYWIICSQQLGYICQLGGACAPFGRRLADLQTLWLSDLMVVWPYGCLTLWSSDLMVIRPIWSSDLWSSDLMGVQPYGRPTLWLSDTPVCYLITLNLMVVQPYGCPEKMKKLWIDLWLSSENAKLMVWPYGYPCWWLSCWWMSANPLKSGPKKFQENSAR